MKKKMKKLWAVLMAVAMVLSLATTALAGATPDPIPAKPYEGDTGNTTEDSLPKSGSANGTSVSEGPLPDDPIEIILPTVPETTAGKMGVFDMILDPHNMIKKTEAARYAEDGITKSFAPFDEATEEGEEGEEGEAEASEANELDATYPKLYFANTVSATEQQYSGESQTLKIINKSRKEVNVNLSLDFDYDSDVLNLVANESDLQNVADGLNEGGAQMYLALVRGDGDSADIKPVTALPVDDEETTDVDESLVPPVFYVDGEGDYLVADGVDFAWGDDADDDIKGDVGNLTFTISYAAPVPAAEEDDASTTDVDETVAIPATISVSGAWGSYTVDGGSVTTEDTFDEETGAADITATVKSADSSKTYATVTFTVVKPNDRTMKDENQVVHFKAPVAGAIINTAIGFKEDAFDYAVWDGTGDKPQGTTDTGYYWKQDQTIEDDAYPFITFKLLGNINNDLAWDQITPANAGINFTLTWDVLQRSTYNKGIVANVAEELPGGDPEPAEPEGAEPAIASVKKGTNSSKNAVITWTPGDGDYANYVPDAEVTLSNDNTATLTVSAANHTMTYTNAYSAVAAGVTATITFRDPTGTFAKTVVLTSTALR